MPLHLLSGMRKVPRDGPGRKEGGSVELVPAGIHSVWVRGQSPPPGVGQGQRRTDLRVGRGRSSPLGAPHPRGCAQTPGTHPHPTPPATPRPAPCRLLRPRPGSQPSRPSPAAGPGPQRPLGLCPPVAPAVFVEGVSLCFQKLLPQPPPQDPLLPGGAWDPGC